MPLAYPPYGVYYEPDHAVEPESSQTHSCFSSPSPERPGRLDSASDISSADEFLTFSAFDFTEKTPPPPPGTPNFVDTADLSWEFIPEPTSASTVSTILSPIEHKPRHSLAHRSLFYKTKPCKFYHENGLCIKGDQCSFIHDTAAERTDHAFAEDVASTDAKGPDRTQHRLPSKSVIRREENHERNFFPVTWRVIGGGVMMSGKREICSDFMAGHCGEGDDCKYAHLENYGQARNSLTEHSHPAPHNAFALSPTLSEDFVYPSVPLFPPISIESAPRPKRVRKLTILKTTQHGEEGYSSHRVFDGDTLLERDATPYKETTVTQDSAVLSARLLVRPMSTPPTPVSRGSSMVRLFSAEMP
ncbi:hypothetical protein BKA93DRAFT_826864 [Sparassis latifolia]